MNIILPGAIFSFVRISNWRDPALVHNFRTSRRNLFKDLFFREGPVKGTRNRNPPSDLLYAQKESNEHEFPSAASLQYFGSKFEATTMYFGPMRVTRGRQSQTVSSAKSRVYLPLVSSCQLHHHSSSVRNSRKL